MARSPPACSLNLLRNRDKTSKFTHTIPSCPSIILILILVLVISIFYWLRAAR